jgi:hypothetical protein
VEALSAPPLLTATRLRLSFYRRPAEPGKTIVVRCNPFHPSQSFFLEQDGAPGKPHIPRLLSYQPYLTDLSLK